MCCPDGATATGGAPVDDAATEGSVDGCGIPGASVPGCAVAVSVGCVDDCGIPDCNRPGCRAEAGCAEAKGPGVMLVKGSVAERAGCGGTPTPATVRRPATCGTMGTAGAAEGAVEDGCADPRAA